MIKRIIIFLVICGSFSISSVYSQGTDKKLPDTKSLLKKIIKIFDFKANADIKKRKELDVLLAKVNIAFAVPLTDSIKSSNILTMLKVKELIDTLSHHQNDNYTSLLGSIEIIGAKYKMLDSLLKPDASLIIPTNDDQLTLLAKLMVPIIKKKVDEKTEEKQKDILLAKINLVVTHSPQVDTIKINDTLSQIIKYHIKKEVKLIGFNLHGVVNAGESYLNLIDGVGYYPFGFNGKNGTLKSIPNWTNSTIYIAARQQGKEIIQTITDESLQNLNDLLKNEKAGTILINNIVNNSNNSVCIWFKNVSKNNFYSFVTFVDSLSTAIKENNSGRKVYIRIPPYVKENWLNFKLFTDKVDYFMVDLTQPVSELFQSPAAPLKGNNGNNIESCIALYTKDIVANKFILCLSYSGFKWNFKNVLKSKALFSGTETYKDIMGKYNGKQLYNDETATAYIDTLDRLKNKSTILFDDEYTLGLKYDYVVNNNLGGVAFWSLGDDDGYAQLYNEMAYKFLTPIIDTVHLIAVKKNDSLSIFQKIKVYSYLYKYMFDNPCDLDFTNDLSADSPYKNILSKSQRESIKFQRNTLIKQLHTGIFFLSLFFLCISVVLIYLYIKNTIYSSEKWKWMKPVIVLMVISFIFLITCVVAALFTIGTVPYFGFLQTDDTDNHCINISFITLLAIVGFGILAGCILTKYLLFPLFKQDDIP